MSDFERRFRYWADRVSLKIAREQAHWEQRHLLWRVSQHVSMAHAARCLGLSSSHGAQMFYQATRERRFGRRSPVERYLAESPFYDAT